MLISLDLSALKGIAMRRSTLYLIIFSLLMAAPVSALDIVGQDPVFDTFVIGVEEPVTLIFDASLNPATVTAGNVILTRVDTDVVVAATLSVETTTLPDDTIVITPNDELRFGKHYRISLEAALTDAGGAPFSGVYPFGTDFAANVPMDMQFPDCAPDDIDCLTNLANPYMGFNPIDPESTDPDEIWTIPGVSTSEAWKWATGRADVIVAVIDDGMSGYDEMDLRDRLFLNQGELGGAFMPQTGDAPCGVFDCNGDGRFSASDYDGDNRLLALSGGDPVTVEHLLQAFSDGTDGDANGLPDDISGWDFFRGVNEVLGVKEFPEGTHGDGADNVASQAQNGYGSRIGMCPDCTVLEIRVSDAVVADFNLMATGARYAREMGAKVMALAMGSFNYSPAAHQEFVDAYEDGILAFAAGGDELGFHHLWPAAGEDVMNVTALFPFPPVELFGFIPMEWIAFTESYCTNYGAHTDFSMPAGHICTSEAVHNSAGAAGLIVSRARDIGIELSAGELKQIINMSADDIKERCASLVEGPSMGGTCHEGFDEHFGYGRMNIKKAFDMLGYPERGIDSAIPPHARITSPVWWRIFDPDEAATLVVEGEMSSRNGDYDWQIEAAMGVQPYDRDFVVLASGSETQPVSGVIATVDVSSVMPENQWDKPPKSANDKTVTLRLRVEYQQGGNRIVGDARKAMQIHRDNEPDTGLVKSFPIQLPGSAESSPRLYDMDGDADGRLEIVFSTSNGAVNVYKFNTQTDAWTIAPGFPVDISGDDPRVEDAVIATNAVGDLLGDGVPKIVAATMRGKIYAIHNDGNLHDGGAILEGFPVAVDVPSNDSSFDFGHGNSIMAAPVIADLDLDGMLEIVVGCYDQQAYAWKPVDVDSDGEADMMPGWPVLLSSAPGLVDDFKMCLGVGGTPSLPAQVLGSPAAGILDPDNNNPDISEHPAVIIPTSEVCNNDPIPTSRVYAIYWNGYENSNGPFLPGWPARIAVPLGDAIPIPPLTTGATNSPAVWIDDDGNARISAGSFLWLPQLIHYDGRKTKVASYVGSLNVTTTSNGTFARFRGDDSMQFLIPTMGPLNSIDGKIKLESWNIVGYDVDKPGQLAFRKRWEDIQFFVNPTVADISGDTLPEVIAGSGGYNVHAYDINENEAEGWPKATHNWGIAAVALGDIDRDGRLEAVMPTHEGFLFAWETKGRECHLDRANSDWRTYSHDEHSTGFYGADTLPPRMITDLDVTQYAGGIFELSFTAPGDDLGCGYVTKYDVRYSTDAGEDLRSLTDFLNADEATVLPDRLTFGGQKQSILVQATENAAAFSIRALDELDQAGWPSVTMLAHDPVPTDDDDDSADDDDDQIMPSDDDKVYETEGDDQECGCGG